MTHIFGWCLFLYTSGCHTCCKEMEDQRYERAPVSTVVLNRLMSLGTMLWAWFDPAPRMAKMPKHEVLAWFQGMKVLAHTSHLLRAEGRLLAVAGHSTHSLVILVDKLHMNKGGNVPRG